MERSAFLKFRVFVPIVIALSFLTTIISPMPKVLAASNVSSLSGLTISVGTLSPTFATGTKSYSDGVAAATASVTVTPTKTNANSTIQVRINGGAYVSVTSGSPTGALTLDASPSTNPIDVLVTAEDAITTTKYTITVVRGAPAAPTNVSAVGESTSTATVYWTAVPGAGSYTATSSPGSITCTANAPAVSCGISTLTSGTSYTFTVTATNNTVTSTASIASNSITMGNAGFATKSIINVQPAGATNGVAFSTQPVVRIVNAEGRLFTNNSYFVVATIASGGGTLSGTTTVMSSSGVATFTNLVLTGAGASSTLTFTPGALIASTSVAFAVAPTSLQITTQPSGAVNGVAFTTQPVVRIVDSDMNTVSPVAAVAVAATIASGTGILSGTMSVSVSAGVATFTNLVITGTVGNFTLTFTPTGLAGLSAVTSSSFALISIPGVHTINSITPGNQSLSVAFTSGTNGNSAITDYKYSTDGGVTWRSAATTSSPFTITTTSDANTALVNGTSYDVQIRAVNSVGDGTPTTSTTATPNPSYTVTFNGNTNSGGSMSSQSANTPTALTSNAFTKTSYSFSGWNTQAGGGGVAYANEAMYAFGTDITLYAQWSNNTYTVTFNGNTNSGGTMSSQSANTPTALTSNAFTKTSYSFSGWNTQAGGGGVAYANEATYDFGTDITLYAQWSGTTYTIIYDNNGGSGFRASGSFTAGGPALTLANGTGFSKSGYVFGGWSTTANDVGTIITTYAFNADANVYAIWVGIPTVTSFTPTSGGDGASIAITGTNFIGATAVKIGATDAANFHVHSSTQITAVVGSGATGTVSVVTPQGTATSGGIFTFLSSTATISALAISEGTLAPAFTGGTFTYTASVAYTVSSMTLTPTVHSSAAIITVNGASVASGSASGSIPLAVGPNLISIVVTAQDGSTTHTYTVTVTRTAASTDATLHTLSISAGTLAPAFTDGIFAYTASVTSVTVTPTTHNSAATIRVNGASVASGSASGSIPLAVGPNRITIVVTAEDGITTSAYTVTVTRTAVSTGAHAIIHAKKLVIIGLRSRGITPIKINFPSKYFGKRATIELGTYKNGKWTIQTLGSVILNSLGDGTYKSKTAVLKGRLIRVKIGMMVLGRASY